MVSIVRNRTPLDEGALVALTCQVVGLGFSVLGQVILARTLGTSQFGVWSFGWNLALVLAVPATLGLSLTALSAIPAWLSGDDSELVTRFVSHSRRLVLGTACLSSGALVLLTLSSVLGRGAFVGAILLPGIAVVSLQRDLLRSIGSTLSAYGLGVAAPPLVLTISACVAAIYDANMVWIVAGCYAAGSAVLIAVQASTIRTWISPDGRHGVIRSGDFLASVLVGKARIMFQVTILAAFMAQGDVVVVGAAGTNHQSGLYFAAARIAALVAFVLTAVAASVAPLISGAWARGDGTALASILSRARVYSVIPAVVVAVPLLVVPGTVLGIFGPGFDAASNTLRVLAVAQLVNAAAGPVGFSLLLSGRESTVRWTFVWAAGLEVGLMVVLLPELGILGAAIGVLLATCAWNAGLSWVAWRHIRAIEAAAA